MEGEGGVEVGKRSMLSCGHTHLIRPVEGWCAEEIECVAKLPLR